MSRRVAVIPGDDAAPEAMLPTLGVLKAMNLDLEFLLLPPGEEGLARYGDAFADVVQKAVDETETTLFGATNGTTPGIAYLRWGKGTFANVRPVRYFPGCRSPLKQPEGIDFVIVRENLEGLYAGIEGDLSVLAPLGLTSMITRQAPPARGGKFALRVITEANTRRVAQFACRLALRRKRRGGNGRLTLAAKYNLLFQTDGLFRRVVAETVAQHPELAYEEYLVDDFAHRLVASPQGLDVVVLPNLYGDILSDEAAATVGGLGLAPSGCYGDDFAYFESAHGTAPDIAGRHTINPTATLLAAAMMLEHLGFEGDARRLEQAIAQVYSEARHLTPDQGGQARTEEFCEAVARTAQERS
jgi:isocitrate/isopropylmalate dehydrogenase